MAQPPPTPTATLPQGWTPTHSSCLQTSDFWVWWWAAPKDQRTVVGGPSQTTDCFPSTPAWNETVVYAGSACPAQYTPASQGCPGSDDSNSVVTCCPTIYHFGCVAATEIQLQSASHGSWFHCISEFSPSDVTMTITTTNLTASTPSSTVRVTTNESGLHLYAVGIVYTTDTLVSATNNPASSTSQTSSTSTATPNQAAHRGISVGASAGIGVGVAALVLLLGTLGFLAFNRKRRQRPRVKELGNSNHKDSGDAVLAKPPKASVKNSSFNAGPGQHPGELSRAAPAVAELGTDRPAELGNYR